MTHVKVAIRNSGIPKVEFPELIFTNKALESSSVSQRFQRITCEPVDSPF
jgi:hypothetical protein